MITARAHVVALAHVSNVLGSVLDAQARRRDRAFGRREVAARRLPGGAAHDGRRRRARLRFLRLFRPQALRPDRDRRALGRGASCSTRCRRGRAAASMIDRVTFAKTTYAPPPAAVRGGNAAHRRRDRASCRDRLCRAASARRDPRARGRSGRARRARRLRSINGVRCSGPRTAPASSASRRRGASARYRHHIGRGGRGDPRRPSLRAAADGLLGVAATARASFGA